MCNAFGIVNYEGPNVNVKGMKTIARYPHSPFWEDNV